MLGALDTLQTVKRLKEAGFNDAQAEAVTNVLRAERESALGELATRADLERFAAQTSAEFAAIRSEMVLLRQEFEAKIEILRRDITIRLGSMIVIATGVLLAAKFFG